VRDGHRLVQADFAEVLQFFLTNHRPDRQPAELRRWKPVLGEEGHAHVGGEIEVRSIRQVTVEVHHPPPGKKLLGVAALKW
jgi:hypothetical protein